MSNRDWRDAEEDWSETGDGYDSGYEFEDDGDGNADDAIPCPDCGAAIFADLDHCPRCGHWLSDSDRAARGTGLFSTRRVRLIAAVLLAAIVLGMLAELALFR
jgi:hypothetical protein